MTLSEWARRALGRAQKSQLGPTQEGKLDALETALRCGHPTASIEEMISNIERDLTPMSPCTWWDSPTHILSCDEDFDL